MINVIKITNLCSPFISPEWGGETSPKVIRLCARHRVPHILHLVCCWQTLGSLEGRYPVMLEADLDFDPRIGGTVRVQTGLEDIPDLGEHPLYRGGISSGNRISFSVIFRPASMKLAQSTPLKRSSYLNIWKLFAQLASFAHCCREIFRDCYKF